MSEIPKWALLFVRDLECLPGYPRTEEGRRAYANQVVQMCGDVETARTLGDLVIAGVEHFPTPIELRRILAREIAKPKDGKNPHDVDLADLMSGGRQV